jgi:hypothetical protein
MQRPTLLEGVLVALVLSLLGGPIVLLLQSLVGSLLAWKAVVVLIASVYIGYLLAQSGRRTGRVTLGLGALAVLLAALLLSVQMTTLLLVALTLIWGIRSFAYSRSLVAAALQGGVCLLGWGAARLVLAHSGHLALALWSFFLVQAAFVLIPTRLTRRPAVQRNKAMTGLPDGFMSAYQAAEQALGRLHTRRAG